MFLTSDFDNIQFAVSTCISAALFWQSKSDISL